MTAAARRPRPRRDGDPSEWPFVPPPAERVPWEEDAQLRSAFEDAAMGMSIANLNWGLLRVNDAHCRMLGHTEHELLTTDFRTRIHPDDLAPNDELRRQLFAGTIDAYETERRYFHRDGHVVWCVDLDNFKPVNDRFGHRAGDGVLVEVARRLSGCLREEDTVARFGGDEFVILLRAVRNRDEMRDIRDRLYRVLEQPHLIEGERVVVTASIGTSLMAAPGAALGDLLRYADQGMYRVKHQRRLELVSAQQPGAPEPR